MSVRVMAWVWDMGPSNGAERLVLLALADFCDDAGRCWPAMATITAKACVTERGARNIVRRLEADGWLKTQVGRGRGGCNTYQVLMSNPERRSGNAVSGMAFRPERDDTLPGTVLPFNRNAGSAEPSRTTNDPSAALRKPKAEAFGAIRKSAKGVLQPGAVQSEHAGAVLQTNPAADAPTEGELLLAAMGADPVSGITGPSSMIGRQIDMAEARKWTEEYRLTLDEQLGVIREVMGRKTKPGAVRSFRYFTKAMVDLAAAKSSPVPSGQAKPPAMVAARAHWRKLAGHRPNDDRKSDALPS